MGNLREFMLKKKGNTNGHELATKRVRRPQGLKAIYLELIIRSVLRLQYSIQYIVVFL